MEYSTVPVKQETTEPDEARIPCPSPIRMIRIEGLPSPRMNGNGESVPKKARMSDEGLELGLGFEKEPLALQKLKTEDHQTEIDSPEPLSVHIPNNKFGYKQFWKAGDFEPIPDEFASSSTIGMDHVRVHPKFLHSNATSHKWALGAFAELLDNSLDEVCNGATYVNVDMLKNAKDGSKMLLVEDDGGGMTPEKMRHCMSLGYSSKSKEANTIGQYGNGFKTSTMRLGADAIVFSRCNNAKRPTQTIGMLSYTFLRSTGKEDIVVPMIDYEKAEQGWKKIAPNNNSVNVWNRNLDIITQWSPYFSEEDLLQQFDFVKEHGTRIIIYNLWEDDQGDLELDFNTDPYDIQIRGVNRDEKSIQMSKQYPNSRHFLTYRHSLRSYASILYLRIPPMFRMILRGKDIEHHNIENDMMLTQKLTYRPMLDGLFVKDLKNIYADVTIGFVMDARYHIDVQGFNVYHKNRLIKPFWRVWNAAGSSGRGVIGVLEANFVEPAHDKQGFERTTVLSRLEQRLIAMQKSYWSSHCQKVGYVGYTPRIYSNKKPKKQSPPPTHGSSGEGSRLIAEPPIDVKSAQSPMVNGNQQHPKMAELVYDINREKERCKTIENNLQMTEIELKELDKEQLTLIDMLAEERNQRDMVEEILETKLNEAYKTIEILRERVRQLEAMSDLTRCKQEH